MYPTDVVSPIHLGTYHCDSVEHGSIPVQGMVDPLQNQKEKAWEVSSKSEPLRKKLC